MLNVRKNCGYTDLTLYMWGGGRGGYTDLTLYMWGGGRGWACVVHKKARSMQIYPKTIRINLGFWETAHLPLP